MPPNPLERDLVQTKWGWGRTQPEQHEVLAQRRFPWWAVYVLTAGLPYGLLRLFGASFCLSTVLLYLVLVLLSLLPVMAALLLAFSHLVAAPDSGKAANYITIKDPEMKKLYGTGRVPILELYDAYMAEKIDVKGDVLQALYNRYDFAHFVFTQGHVRYFLGKLIPELLWHSRAQDTDQVTEHYDRGNDFYNWFLGDSMVYTSGIFHDSEETLEKAQQNKMELLCQKLHMEQGMTHLDIGCGWGTLVRYCAEKYGTESTGYTLAKEQVKYHNDKVSKELASRAQLVVSDYRDIRVPPSGRPYDRITCIEMSEHVGVLRYPAFVRQVRDLLADDGLFLLQIAGLRRPWQFEDLMWGCFMGSYVFPGADASCPLAWVIDQLEGGGFEIHSVENIGIHYSATIKRWYDNWVSNKNAIVKKYGETWFRKWCWFLGWSVISPEQGSATCFQIVAHKNTRNFNRKRWIAERSFWKI